ncbi:hypothetical protein AMTRI_Chr09g37770 [Amborella trichopoda]
MATRARSWRTAFLTLRDEMLTSPAPATVLLLLRDLLSQAKSISPAAPHLPSHEVASDVMLLVQLLGSLPKSVEASDVFIDICHLIYDISCRVRLDLHSTSQIAMMNFLGSVLEHFCCEDEVKRDCIGDSGIKKKTMMETLQILGHIASENGGKFSELENAQMVKLLLHIISMSHAELFLISRSSNDWGCARDFGYKVRRSETLWDVRSLALVMMGDAFSRIGATISADIWQSTLEVLRKIMDVLASKSVLVVDSVLSRYYTSLLQCLHLVLSDSRGSLTEHVAGLMASLKMFFFYGLTDKSTSDNASHKIKDCITEGSTAESEKSQRSTYRPPHLRKRERLGLQSVSEEPPGIGMTSSESEHSDSDGSLKDVDHFRCSKARVAAIICIQDLYLVDPKTFHSQLTLILPTTDVLQPRNYQGNLMTCLLYDPVLKTRLAAAATLAAILGGPSPVYLQVAEYKESTKCGSFTSLSSALGQTLMQLHSGLLYLIQRESHSGLLTSLFKALTLLISATPYSRMPEKLLPAVILSLQTRSTEFFDAVTDQSCLAVSIGRNHVKLGLIATLLLYSRATQHPSLCSEALQVLRAVIHNYPEVMSACWERVSCIVYELLKLSSSGGTSYEILLKPCKGDSGTERFVVAAIKALDELLRAVSGFKGLDDIIDDRPMDSLFVSKIPRKSTVYSAPLLGVIDGKEVFKASSISDTPGSKEWNEVIEKHLPMCLLNVAPMIRSAAIICFAGLTSSVFFSLSKDKQDFVLSSVVKAALFDEIAAVNAASCRAIGVISCFPEIPHSAEIMDQLIHAIEVNTHNALVSVRIAASWALANICDSLRYSASNLQSGKCSSGPNTNHHRASVLAECALRLTKDGDKMRANAVRALGNLSRFVCFSSTTHTDAQSCSLHCTNLYTVKGSGGFAPFKACKDCSLLNNYSTYSGCSHWLERMVQAFVSCVTTGNAKVQWNVCHALGNLFLNDTIRLQHMAWSSSVYSILLLLLRDSTNFKIRIHAAAALAVPGNRHDYGNSFSDVLQGLEHVLESLGSDQGVMPSSFQYKKTLEEQLSSTTLHVLSLASSEDYRSLKDFLIKKTSFFEVWLKSTCSSIEQTQADPPSEDTATNFERDESVSSVDELYKQRKALISVAIKSLIELYKSNNHHNIARKFEKLEGHLS